MATHNFFSSSSSSPSVASSSSSSSTFTFRNIPIGNMSSNSPEKTYEQGNSSNIAGGFDDDHGDDVDLFCTKYGFYQETGPVQSVPGSSSNQQQQQSPVSVQESMNLPSLSLAPSDILGNRPNAFLTISAASSSSGDKNKKLSAMQIVRLAGERFVQFSDHKFININIFMHPYSSTLSELCSRDKQDVELVQLLLAAADKVSDHQFERAIRLIKQCQESSSFSGSPAQRAVFYFSEALQARIERETQRLQLAPPPPSSSTDDDRANLHDGACLASRFNISYLAWYQKLPFAQVLHLSATQTILEHVAGKPKVHLVDFCLRTGVQWSTLMQALSEQEPNRCHFRFTAVETREKEKVEETGKRLQSFADNFNLPFTFKVLYIPDLRNLTAEQLEAQPDEAVVIHFSFVLRTMISKPLGLERIMRAMTGLNPTLMVVEEVEANLNSPSFVHRFIDALFYYSAYLDALEEAMGRNDPHRTSIEGGVFRDAIGNIVSAEGRERVARSVGIAVWREFFGRFGLEETELSQTCWVHANMVIQQFGDSKNRCAVNCNGKSLVVAWKGTPIYSFSAWKFQSPPPPLPHRET